VFAYEQREKYKEGKFIIEREYMLKNSTPEVDMDDEEEKEEHDIVEEIEENSME